MHYGSMQTKDSAAASFPIIDGYEHLIISTLLIKLEFKNGTTH